MKSRTILAEDGPMSAAIEGYSLRRDQVAMAEAIEDALTTGRSLVVEAATGTGKTLGYLVGAIASGARVIISTGTRTLQDQVYYKEIPVVREALDVPFEAAMLKGRSNYLCLRDLETLLHRPGVGVDSTVMGEAVEIKEWSMVTSLGDISELTTVPEVSPAWRLVTTDGDRCAGAACALFGDCFVFKARRAAQRADVILVNHSLLFTDILLKQKGASDILPSVDGIVIDEAHQVRDWLTRIFGASFSSRAVRELRVGIEAETSALGADDLRMIASCDELLTVCDQLGDRLRSLDGSGVLSWSLAEKDEAVLELTRLLEAKLSNWAALLASAAERSQELERLSSRAAEIANGFSELMTLPEDIDGRPTGPLDSEAVVRWMEHDGTELVVHASPLDVAGEFREIVTEVDCSWVFTSATLAVGQSLDYFIASLGLEDHVEPLILEGSFDFGRQALFYVPQDLPDPGTRGFTEASVVSVLPVIEMLEGRTFYLFTSYRALHEANRLLETEELNLFVQGSLPKMELLRRFRASERAVLLATASFWEGVDVKGDDLSCVIVDKLPFRSPSEPVVGAIMDAMQASGQSGFREYLLPQAVIALKQGFGRLIRDATDWGVFILTDRRVLTRGYGRGFISNLPDMPLTTELQDVAEFLGSRREP